ncbi:MAG TPA: hypothetical protein VL359_18975, partial [bacterium]|nr:hypothetical protein [bacterium]
MALSRFLKSTPTPPPRGQTAPGAPEPKAAAPAGLAGLLSRPIVLAPERDTVLREGLAQGLKFFEDFNDSRLKIAFASFDAEMKQALYEVLFLLHVNDPKLQNYRYSGVALERVGGALRERPFEGHADLYVPGAPHGVEGLDRVSPVFRQAFQEHVQKAFGMPVTGQSGYGYNPIVSVHSLGSIGTVGHKSRTSDLDLQVQYELEPFLIETKGLNDQVLKEGLLRELKGMAGRIVSERKQTPVPLQESQIRAGVEQLALQQVAKQYPNLHRYLIQGQRSYTADLAGPSGPALRGALVNEMIQLLKRMNRAEHQEELKKQEALLQERMKRIQEYLQARYPNTEVYLFTCSNEDYRLGRHGSTLTNKEASGSAYELILNYETLMPGIQMTPMVPTHFVLPKAVNNDPAVYERVIDYIRVGILDAFSQVRERLVNLGPTPDLEQAYVAKHSGAVYWEAFKASSGNLPKALLNLFRYEMLLDKRFLKTNIQIIKEPSYLNRFATPRPADVPAELPQIMDENTGVPPWVLVDMEDKFPKLLQDPWWQRYKALKIAFAEQQGIRGMTPEEHRRASKIIDMAFALHVRISDVFTKPGDTRPFDSYREQVLLEFLRRAFPPITEKRKFLEHLFIGEVHSVNSFEQDMRELFKTCLARVNQKIAELNVQGQGNQKEFEIWYHYYQSNFEPAPNVVPRTIMNHLKVARGRLQIGYKLNEGWYFRSQQKESKVGKRFDTFGYLDHLPEEVMLREKSGFLAGLADCVLNGYYGILNEGTLKETRTAIEFDAKAMDLGNRTDNTLAYVRPDNVHRILNLIIGFFRPRPYHYMDCISKKRQVVDVLLFLNLVKFGRLSVLYRDNLLTWYCEEWEHPDLFNRAHNLRAALKLQILAKPLHVTLAKFFKAKDIRLSDVKLGAWVNPHSVDTPHSAQQEAAKEKDLSEEFLRVVNQVHGRQ